MNEQERLKKARQEKLDNFISKKINPYPSKTKRTHTTKEALDSFSALERQKKKVALAGRIVSIREHGGLTFGNIRDESGTIQFLLNERELGKTDYKFFRNFDLGDFIQIEGALFKTKKGENTIQINKYRLLAKSLSPLPEKWHGLCDTEERHRKRYLDLLSNKEVGEVFRTKSRAITFIRDYLDSRGFLEVETPTLQYIPGGASARPFATHHNVLKQNLYLRIAPELYLKRLIVGGFERVYELGRSFRNEGVDTTHNPEFTMLEFYVAYWDYEALMEFTEGLFADIVKAIKKNNKIEYQGNKIEVKEPFVRIRYKDAVKKYAGIDLDKSKDAKSLFAAVIKKKVKNFTARKTDSWAKIADELFKETVKEKLIQPTFVYDYPAGLTPLAKKKENDDGIAEVFQLYCAGLEMTKCYSELNDPQDQKRRFLEQEKERKRGDEEAQFADYDYVEALSYGMPPTAGFGMGIDRLTMLLCNQPSIREVILFPALRSKKDA